MGKILQERQSVNINRNTQSTSFSTQMDFLVPEGKIATLPQGFMAGQVTDNFGEQVGQKNFNCLILADEKALEQEEKHFVPIPDFYDFDNMNEVLERNRNRIQNDIREMVIRTTQTIQKNDSHEQNK